MAAQKRSVERFSFTARCCYTMVRALSAVIVMAESVSGSYLTDALMFLWAYAFVAGTAGLKRVWVRLPA
jgi:cytochrome b subunit of formate dehydrogenase